MTNTDLENLKTQALKELTAVSTKSELSAWEILYFGRKRGRFTEFFKQLPALDSADKKELGRLLNETKLEVEKALAEKRQTLGEQDSAAVFKNLDVTAPGRPPLYGSLHPITKVQQELEGIFQKLGFVSLEGPELENDFYNFEALNIPKGHPARDMWDTFYVKSPEDSGDSQLLLRTHTSPMQVRVMQIHQPPFAIIVPGRTFRHEATDSSHEHTFDQMEGLVIGRNISVANLKHVLKSALGEFFGQDLKMQLRPSYFPFVEPGFEVAVECAICRGASCSTCSGGWLELLGAGMVHPQVFTAAGLDPDEWTGFAFGFGLSRFAMIKYGIADVRLFAQNDIKFLQQ